MGTEVLHPRDVLSERLRIPHASFQRRKNLSGNLNINRRPLNSHSSQRKTAPRPDKKFPAAVVESGGSDRGSQVRKEDVTASGPVILLRRGESLDSLTAKIKGENFKVEASKPKPKPVDDSTLLGGKVSEQAEPKPICFSPLPYPDGYAGSAAYLSPPPQSLPLPTFFNKKQQNDSEAVDDSATRNLRRLLRLD